jgi:hypothetical protein
LAGAFRLEGAFRHVVDGAVAGDVIELGVEGLGTQKQKVVAFKGKRA